MSEFSKLREIIQIVYDKRQHEISISPSVLATEAMTYLDPLRQSAPLVALAAHLEFRQIARRVCRGSMEDSDINEDEPAFDFHKALQTRYPTARSAKSEEPEYILLEHMSDEDYAFNIQRLEREADAKTAHARALKAYWTLKSADEAA